MAQLGSPNYKVGLIIARAQPFHNGHLKIIADALMKCDEIIVSFVDYNTNFFDYDINQQLGREVLGLNKRISYFGTLHKPTLQIPKHYIEETLIQLEDANYNMPTHFFTHYEDWVTPAMELQLETKLISTLVDNSSRSIYESLELENDDWKTKVPYSTIEMIETYIATKKRKKLIV